MLIFFYPLLDFLELKTLVVTDLDSIKKVEKENNKKKKINVWEKCPVAEGTRTCNTAIRYWFAPKDIKKIEDFHLSPVELLAKTPTDKQVSCRRIAYQIPEDPNTDVCARSYEDALILAKTSKTLLCQMKRMLLLKLGSMRRGLLNQILL